MPVGCAVLDASRRASIPHASICGGRGRCTTCRIRVLRGFGTLPPPEPSSASHSRGCGRDRACVSRANFARAPTRRDRPYCHPTSLPTTGGGVAQSVATSSALWLIMFVDIRQSTALVEKRLPYDVVFLLNHFFAAVAGAVVEAGGSPNQFVGDGMMAIFGMRDNPREACRQALSGRAPHPSPARRDEPDLVRRTAAANRIGIGLHAGDWILGELGYRDRFLLTAIGDSVHVAARLQDLTKEYGCQLVVSEIVTFTAEVNLDAFPERRIGVRGREYGFVRQGGGTRHLMNDQPAQPMVAAAG